MVAVGAFLLPRKDFTKNIKLSIWLSGNCDVNL
jgi:hypothetical protein